MTGSPQVAPATNVITVVPAAAGAAASSSAVLPSLFANVTSQLVANGPMLQLGTQTHFNQGWSPSVLSLANQIGVKSLRDTVNWASVETHVGSYDFNSAPVQALQTFCASGGKLSLTIVPQNALYDGGNSVYTDQGRQAYAAYIDALLARFGGCVSAIEVGNEINNPTNLVYPVGYDRSITYVALLKTLYSKIKPKYPAVTILGGSTNAIGTGFLTNLFAAGMLSVIDAVAVHPYRDVGEGLDLELAHLQTVMKQYGTSVPVWATEFSYDTPDQRLAAAGLAKSVAQFSSSNVEHAFWYSLITEKYFPNLGIFNGTSLKTQGLTFQAITQRLLPYGKAVRVDTGDNLTYLYRFGTDRWLVWGAPRQISFANPTAIRDVTGNLLWGNTVQVSPEPVIVEGATGYTLGDKSVVADTLLQYGSNPWSYIRRGSDNRDVPLSLFDNDYTSYFGDRWSKPLRINNTSAAPAGDATSPMRAIIRYTATSASQLDLEACFSKALTGDGVDYRIERNGILIAGGILTDKIAIHGLPINVASGDRIDLSFGPNKTYGGDSFAYRAVLSIHGKVTTLPCS